MGNWGQIGVQVLEAVVGFVWSYIFFGMIDCIPGLEVLATDRYVMAVPLKAESTSYLKVYIELLLIWLQ